MKGNELLSSIRGKAERLIRRSFIAASAYYAATDLLAELLEKTGYIKTRSGTIHSDRGLESSIDYIEDVFGDYKKYSGVETFHGRVAELGPGDSSGVALLFLNDGCASVDLVDRFYSTRDEKQHAEIYRELVSKYPCVAANCMDGDSILPEAHFSGVQRHYGRSAAAEEFFRSRGPYDFIVSRAVMEHLYDPVSALKDMATALAPGGMMLHKVDLRDHGMYSGCFHELRFLEVPSGLFRRMTRASGRPNRVLVNRYRETLEECGLQVSVFVTRLASAGDIIPHRLYNDIAGDDRERSIAYVRSVRDRFAREFQALSDEDLSVTGFFLIAKKGMRKMNHE